jgi:hypothetical protein
MRKICKVCGMYRGAKPHTGPIHARIRKARKALKRRIR